MNARPKIGIDTQSMTLEKTGFGFYLESLLKELALRNNRYDFVYIDTIKTNLNTPKRILWDQFWLPHEARKNKLDLLFVPAFSVPFLYRGKKIVTAHDIIGRLFSENFSFSSKMYWKYLLPKSFQSANHVITISKRTKNDLHEYLRIPLEKITVIPLGARSIFRIIHDSNSIQSVLDRYQLQADNFALTVGTIEPRKNLPKLVEAWASLSSPMPLVIVGKKGWGYRELMLAIQKHNMEKSIQLLDYVSDGDLAALYNACRLFVLPSLYEGFGLPVLEAMACGAPVVISNNSSLPEVAEEAGTYFDPRNRLDLERALSQTLSNKKFQTELREKSLLQAKKFSWKKCAEQTLAVFDSLLA